VDVRDRGGREHDGGELGVFIVRLPSWP
jgi:hypothetical protein